MNILRSIVIAVFAVTCAMDAVSMPSRDDLKKVQGIVKELMDSDLQAMKARKKMPSQVAANAESLAKEAQSDAARFLLYKGAFGLYVQGGDYDKALNVIERLKAEVKDVPDKVVAEMLREKLKRIPKKSGRAIFDLYDTISRRMTFTAERAKLEAQIKTSPSDKSLRRLLATRCAQLGDWEAARGHFAEIGGQEAAAAKSESSDPAAAADFWWGYQPGDEGDAETFREHAAALYRAAIDAGKLAGLKLVLAKKRIAEVDGGDEATPSAGSATVQTKVTAAAKSKPEKVISMKSQNGNLDWSVPPNLKDQRTIDVDVGGGEKIRFFAIPPGDCVHDVESQGLAPHKIKITRPFWISQFPVLSRQFRASGIEPSYMGGDFFEEKFADDDNAAILAAALIGDIKAYFEWLNRRFGNMLPKGWVFRLPTEGECLRMRDFGRENFSSFASRSWTMDDRWVKFVQKKGLFMDCRHMRDVYKSGIRCQPITLLVEFKELKESNIPFTIGRAQLGLDRVSIPGLKLPHSGPYTKELADKLSGPLNYQPTETDPFRYCGDGEQDTWWSYGGGMWAPIHAPNIFRVVAGPDYVGEWKAKHGK